MSQYGGGPGLAAPDFWGMIYGGLYLKVLFTAIRESLVLDSLSVMNMGYITELESHDADQASNFGVPMKNTLW